jgi:two-component system cell cycle sensor histidine kinase/response regulator CckA
LTPDDDREWAGAFDLAFRDAPEPMWCWVVGTGEFLAVNQAAVDLYGWTAEEFMTMTLDQIHPPEQLAQLREVQEPDDFLDTSCTRRCLHWSRDGRLLPLVVTSHPLVFAGRRARVAVGSDQARTTALMSRLDATDPASRVIEARLHALLGHTTDVVGITDAEGRIRVVSGADPPSPAAVPEPIREEDAFALIHREDTEAVRSMVRRARSHRGDTVGPLQYRFVDPGGDEVWVETTWVDLTHDPAIAGMVTHTRDITQRRLEERERSDREERFRLLVEYSDDAMIVVGRDRQVIYQTPNMARLLLGWDADGSMLADSLIEIHPESEPLLGAAIRAAAGLHGEAVQLDVKARVEGEWQILDTTVRDLRHLPSVGGLAFNLRDVTDRRRTEQQYLHAQKMEALGRLVGGIVHDFNNLLTVVTGHADLLLDAKDVDDPDRSGLQAIHDASTRAVELTAQLLSVTRHRVVAPEVFDLNDRVRILEPMVTPMLGEDVRLVTSLSERPALIRADRGRVDQVLLNLVVNARDALPGGGVVTIRTDVGPGGDLFGGADRACVSVEDNGVGMSDEILEHLFEPFFTTKGEGLGTGLGLATAHGIVEQAGGRIDVTSEPGLGSTFRVCIPLADPGGLVEGPSAARPVGRDARGASVLVVEDDELVRALAVRMLSAAGFSVTAAGSITEAAAVLADPDQSLDVIVTDVILTDGRASRLAALRDDLRPGLPTLYVSGYAMDSMVRSGEVAHGVEFLAKPYRPAELVERVSALLGLEGGTPP